MTRTLRSFGNSDLPHERGPRPPFRHVSRPVGDRSSSLTNGYWLLRQARTGSRTACRDPGLPPCPAEWRCTRSEGCRRGSCPRPARPDGTEAASGDGRGGPVGRTSAGGPIRAGSRIAPRRPSSEGTQVGRVSSGRDKEFTLQLPIRDNPTGTVVLNPFVPPTSGSTKPRRSPSCRGFVVPRLPQATPPSSRRGTRSRSGGITRAGPSTPLSDPSSRGPSPSTGRRRHT